MVTRGYFDRLRLPLLAGAKARVHVTCLSDGLIFTPSPSASIRTSSGALPTLHPPSFRALERACWVYGRSFSCCSKYLCLAPVAPTSGQAPPVHITRQVGPRNVFHGSRLFLIAIYRPDGATYCKQCHREVLDRSLAALPQGKAPLETYKHCRSLGIIKHCRLCARPTSVSGFVSEAPAADPARCLRRCLFRPPRRTPTRKRCIGRSSRTAFSHVIIRL